MDSVIFEKIFLCILLCVCVCVCWCLGIVCVCVCFHLVLLYKSFYKVPNRRAVNQRVTTDFSRLKCTCASIPLVHNGRNPSRAVFHFRTKPRIFLPPQKPFIFLAPTTPNFVRRTIIAQKRLYYMYLYVILFCSLSLFFPLLYHSSSPISCLFPNVSIYPLFYLYIFSIILDEL